MVDEGCSTGPCCTCVVVVVVVSVSAVVVEVEVVESVVLIANASKMNYNSRKSAKLLTVSSSSATLAWDPP